MTSAIPPIQHRYSFSAELEEMAQGKDIIKWFINPICSDIQVTLGDLWSKYSHNKVWVNFQEQAEISYKVICLQGTFFFFNSFSNLKSTRAIALDRITCVAEKVEFLSLKRCEEFRKQTNKQTKTIRFRQSPKYWDLFHSKNQATLSWYLKVCFPWCYQVRFFAVLCIIKLVLIYPQNPNTICSLQTKKQKLSGYTTKSHVFINGFAWLIAAILIQKHSKHGFSHYIFHNQPMTSRWMRCHKISSVMCLRIRILMLHLIL